MMMAAKYITLSMCLSTVIDTASINKEPQRINSTGQETRLDRPLNLTQTNTTAETTTVTKLITTTETWTTTNETKNFSVIIDKIQNRRFYDYAILSWLKNDYVMSFAIPIAAGVGSALILIAFASVCRCCKNRCQRRQRKKFLKDNIKRMNLADRMKLLGETSDEEF